MVALRATLVPMCQELSKLLAADREARAPHPSGSGQERKFDPYKSTHDSGHSRRGKPN